MEKDLGYFEALEKAMKAAQPGEELIPENFNRVNTEGFEGLVVILKRWSEMIFDAVFQLNTTLKRNGFRMELIYNAETKKTSLAIYTPTKDGKDGNKQESSED